MTDKTPDEQFNRIAKLWAGGEHLRAAALAAEQKYPEAKLEELSILCPGIKDHMPAGVGNVLQKGTVPGDPVADEMQRLGVDENQIGEINRQHEEEGKSPKAALAEADLKPAGTPRNDGIDGPTLHTKAEHRDAPKASHKGKRA